MPARPAGIVTPRRLARVRPFPSADGCAAAGLRTCPSLALLSEILSPLSFPPSLLPSHTRRWPPADPSAAPLARCSRTGAATSVTPPRPRRRHMRARANRLAAWPGQEKKKRTIFQVKLSRHHFALDTISKRTPDFQDLLNSETFAVTRWSIFRSRKAAIFFLWGLRLLAGQDRRTQGGGGLGCWRRRATPRAPARRARGGGGGVWRVWLRCEGGGPRRPGRGDRER